MLTIGDRLLIAVILGCALLGLFVLPGFRSQGTWAIVEAEQGVGLSLDLAEDGQWQVQGPLGETVIEIENGCVRIISSPCPHKLCVHMGCGRRAGDIIACIPNGVVVHVRGDEKRKAVDGITR